MAQAQTWMYYLLSEGTLTGWGEYTGSTFALAHQPESKFYGTQLGEGGPTNTMPNTALAVP